MTNKKRLIGSKMRRLVIGSTESKMRRLGNIGEQFLSYENFDSAERKARKNKKRNDIRRFDKKYTTDEARRVALEAITVSIRAGAYTSATPTANYRIAGGKTRKIATVPYYPDRIVHFALFNVIRERFSKYFIKDMYSYDKGVHELTKNLSSAIRRWDKDKPIYVLKFDVRKYYDSIDYRICAQQIRRIIKDKVVLGVIDEMLAKHDGVLIGMLLSTLFSSLYLTPIDRFVKDVVRVKHYYRFADDFICLSEDKKQLQELSWRIKSRLWYELGLETNYSLVFDIRKRPLDFCGYVHYPTHTRIRKETKKKFVKNRHNEKSVASYLGMLKWCNSKHLQYKTLIQNNYAKERRTIS